MNRDIRNFLVAPNEAHTIANAKRVAELLSQADRLGGLASVEATLMKIGKAMAGGESF